MKLRRRLCALMAAALAFAYPASADVLAALDTGSVVRSAGRVVVIRDPQQVDVNVYWFALDPGHASYAATIATLEATAAAVPARYGTYAVADGANGYTGLKIVGPCYGLNGLSISASGVCRDIFNYICSKNPNYAAPTLHTNAWGDTYRVYGKFLKAPRRIPTTGEDARLNDAKGVGSKTIIYIGQENVGTGDGSSYLNRRRVRDFLGGSAVDLLSTDIVVLCGELSRLAGEGGASFGLAHTLIIKSGTSGSRTQVLSHPVDRAILMGGVKLGDGAWHTDAAWTDEGGGMWSITNPGAADPTLEFGGTAFSMTNAGGTRRALTSVASSAACAALADGIFVEADYSGGTDRIYVRLADGSDPKTTTFIGPTNTGGVTLLIAGKEYFDVFGIEFYQHPFVGSGSMGATQYAMYACKFAYVAFGALMVYGGGAVNEATGDFLVGSTPVPPVNRWIIGCEFSHASQAIYDTCVHDLVPVDQIIADNYCHSISLASDYGFNLHSTADAHVFAVFGGWDGAIIENNSFQNVGSQPIVIYNSGTNFATPTGGLELTAGYVSGFNYPSGCIDRGDGTWDYGGAPSRNLKIKWNWLRDMNVENTAGGAYAATSDMGISLNGDAPMFGSGGKFGGIEIAYNRIEGQMNDGAIRLKWAYPDGDTDVPWIHHNTIRDALLAFYTFTVTNYGGTNYDPSFLFENNDVHARTFFVVLSNVLNPDHHSMILRNNRYRTDNLTNGFRQGGSGANNLADWTGLAPAGDVYDAGSTTALLGA